MSRLSTYFLSRVLLFLLIFVCASTNTAAQSETSTKFGISFSSEISDVKILTVLPALVENGIDVIELNQPVSNSLLDSLSRYQIQLLIRSDLQFFTASEINNSEGIRTELAPFIVQYSNSNQIVGLGLTSYSHELPKQLIQSLRNQLPDSISVNFYQVGTIVSSEIISVILTDSFDSNPSAQYYVFEAPFLPSDITVLSHAIDSNPELILMDWNWFVEASTKQSYFDTALSIASDSFENLFPKAASTTSKTVSEWPIIILVLLWISLGIHVRSNLTYRPLIFRYFTFHRFFVDDIMRYRERSPTPGIVLFIQHAFFTGLIVYVLGNSFISEKGLQAFYFHLPILALFGQNYFNLFALTIALSLLISLICLLWLYVPSSSMNHFSQVLSLYSWIFHVDFILVSITLILLITDGSQSLILLLCATHFIFWVMAFVVAAFDSSKYQMKERAKYLFKTIGLFLVLTFASILGFLLSGYPLDIIYLAISL